MHVVQYRDQWRGFANTAVKDRWCLEQLVWPMVLIMAVIRELRWY